MESKYYFPALLFTLIIFFQGCSSKNPPTATLRNLDNGICHDTVSGLLWQSGKSQPVRTLKEAQLYVEELTLGGYTDWRLPTQQELYDLTSLFDLHLNGECTLSSEGDYWSGEIAEEGMAGCWEFSANQCDSVRQYVRRGQGHVRAVRP